MMKMKVGIILTVVLVLCFAAYMISAQTPTNNDTDETYEAYVPDSTEETGKTEDETTERQDLYSSETVENNEQDNANDGVTEDHETDGLLAGSGTFMGRIDNNFIEIDMDDGTTRSFQIGESIRDRFDDYGFDTGDSVRFSYREREGQNPIIEAFE